MTPALLLGLSLLAPDPPRDRWIGEDKMKHFFTSFVATSITARAARAAGLDVRSSAWVGAGAGTAVGVWKEIRDQRRRDASASVRDLVWDAAGVAAGAAVMRQVR